MRETNKARQAFEDYFGMGAGRSLRALHEIYCVQKNTEGSPIPPTARLPTLKKWSSAHGWQDRVARREKEIAEAKYAAIVEGSIEAGYAYWPKRVEDLDELARTMYRNLRAAGGPSRFLGALKEYRALLDDIASEMGERVKRTEVSGPDAGPIEVKDIEAVREKRWEGIAGMMPEVVAAESEDPDEGSQDA